MSRSNTAGPADASLPIDALRAGFARAITAGPVVISAPTGSGKSTRVPTWFGRRPGGPVWVIEPRRVACRALATRVAELEGETLGEGVGYRVRDDDCSSPSTRILFVTPGIALRQMSALQDARAVVLDELHERRLDVDLLLALLRAERERGAGAPLVVMSATFAGEQIAEALGGTHLRGEGRMFPVEIRHVGTGPPRRDGLGERLFEALERAEHDEGDILVFLPGKAEIARAESDLTRHRGPRPLEVMALHGGLSLAEQSRVFAPTRRRKVILSTNVAETSLTVPGVGVVIDSGLVRRTQYHQGRSFLALLPIAADSAEQRSGRAGRTGPGVGYRLFSKGARLAAATPPEMHRESLVPLLLAAGALGEDVEALPFLDPPKSHALDAAREELAALGALDQDGLTDAGRALSGLPIDPHLARLLVEAKHRAEHDDSGDGSTLDTLDDVLDLVAALSVGRPMFRGEASSAEEDDLRQGGCDALALIRAVRLGDAARNGLSPFALREARRAATRLRQAFGRDISKRREIDRRQIAMVAMAADGRVAHIARKRKRHVAYANGGGEVLLGRESATAKLEHERAPEALIVLGSRAIGSGRERKIIATAAMPAPLDWLKRAGLGRDRLAGVRLVKRRIVADVERVYAKRVLETRETTPSGAMAREAIAALFLRGTIFKGAGKRAKLNIERTALLHQLQSSRLGESLGLPPAEGEMPPPIERWLEARLVELGVGDASDLALLSESDLMPDPVPEHLRSILDGEFPRTVNVGDAEYRADIDLEKRQVNLVTIRGGRKKPPPASYIPRFGGFQVCVEAGRVMHVVRKRAR